METQQNLNINSNKIINICIYQTAFIGDTLLTLFFVAKLKTIYKNSKIYFVCKPDVEDIINKCKEVDEVIVYDKRNKKNKLSTLKYLINTINKLQIDIFYNIHNSIRAHILTYFVKSKTKYGYKNIFNFFIYNYHINTYYKDHYVFKLYSIFNENTLIYPSFISDNYNMINNKEYIVMCIGSVWKTKKWGLEKYIELIRLLNDKYNIVLLGGKHEQYETANINLDNILNLCGQTSLYQSLEIIKNAKIVVTNDSSPTHIASLVNTPTITIYGPTDPIFGFAPLSNNSKSIKIDTLECRPCHIHGLNKCPVKHHNCMKLIEPEMVYNEIMSII